MSARKIVVACVLAASCTGAQRKESAPVEVVLPAQRLLLARRAADERPADALLQARAGWLIYLIESDPKAALERFSLAEAQKGATPEALQMARCGRGEILEDRLDATGAAKAWRDAVAADPKSPWAELAALRLLDVEGDSEDVDEVVASAPALVANGGSPRAARFLREAAARVLRSSTAADAAVHERSAWAAMGAVGDWRVAGPLASLRLLPLTEATALDGAVTSTMPATGPAGTTGERTLRFPDGDVGLELEPGDGDLFYAQSELTVASGGAYLAWFEGAAAAEVRLDGEVVFSRSPWPREVPRAIVVPIDVTPGAHEVLVRWSRAEGSRFRMSFVRRDGLPGDIRSEAPAALSARRAPSPCALGTNCSRTPAWSDDEGLRGFAERALKADGDDAIASWLQVRSLLPDDRLRARFAIDRLVSLTSNGAAALALRASFALRDLELPDRLGRAAALADLRKATTIDPLLLRARLTAAALERDSERPDDAEAELKAAEQAIGPALPVRLLLARARLMEQQGNVAGQKQLATQAFALEPRRCDVRQMLFDIARREGGVGEQEKLAASLGTCIEARPALAAFLRDRQRLERAQALAELKVAMRPAVPQGWQELGDLQLSRGDADAARRSFEEVVRLAPRSPEPWRRLVWLAELQHDPRAALKARKEQLARSPGDLKLRRQVEKDQGRGLLAWTDRDGVALALGHQTSKLTEGDDRPAALRLLDYGAAEFFDDGSAAERSHTVARLLDKKGIGRFGEAQLPNDAEILELRTIKPDGRVLEPDAIPNKDTVSLPGLEAGDSIEIDWLRAWPARGSDLRGVSMSGFYFLDDETPMLESTYEVRGPSTLPLEVDAHHLDAPPPKIDAEGFHWRYSARDVAPRPPEPNQPTDTEITPWVQVGWGAGQAQLAVQLADWSLLRARPSATVDALVLAAGGVSPMEKLTRLSASIAQAVRGRSNGLDFAQPAAHVLRSGRGNRLLVLQAALNTLGIKSRFALVRPFGADPAPMRFPRGDVFAAGVLTVELPTGTVWLDSTMRLGPVGGLPPTLRGQAAWIVPLPGEEPKLVTTPEAGPSEGEGRLVKFDLELSRSGDARGHGVDELRGFEAASLRDALERLDPVQRKQGVEAMLGRSLRGVVLEDLTTQGESTQGGPASLLYTLSLPLGRPDASGVKVPASLLPAQLGRRYLQKTERALPLLIENAERSAATVRLKLPQGLYASELPQPVVLKTAGAEFRWAARMDAGTLVLDEALVIDKSRIAPKDYPAFAEFARAVDAAQEQEIALIPVGKMAAR